MKIQNVENCSFNNWYGNLKQVTFQSEIIPIPSEVVKYLLTDGIVLPKSAVNGQYHHATRNDEDVSDDEVEWDHNSGDEHDEVPSFPEFEEKVTHAIKRLGGRVFPKLNWSAPRDAAWVALNNSLMCQTMGDVFLLLKSSDFITRDLTQPFLYCDDGSEANEVDYDLVLRRWHDIVPGGEFRCFVKDRQMIGICQRAQNVHFPHLDAQKDAIISDLVDFYQNHLEEAFPDDDYVFDVYRQEEGEVKLVDLNPFGDVCTDSLLFSWSELKSLAEGRDDTSLPEFRHGENHGVQPSPYQHFALPRDIVDLCAGEDPNKLMDIMKLHENVAGSPSDEEESALS